MALKFSHAIDQICVLNERKKKRKCRGNLLKGRAELRHSVVVKSKTFYGHEIDKNHAKGHTVQEN